MPSTATPREEPSTLTRLLRGAKRGARNVYDGATAQYFRPQEFAQGMSDAMVAAPDAIINALRSPRETIRAGLEATKDAFATPERTGATLVGAIPSLINALRGRGAKKDIIISEEQIPRAQRLKLPISDYWVDRDGQSHAWLSDKDAKLKSPRVTFHNGNYVDIVGDTGGPRPKRRPGVQSEYYTPASPLMGYEVDNLLKGQRAAFDSPLEFQDYIDHPDLFKLEPDLRHVPVHIVPDREFGGGFDPAGHGRIYLNAGAFRAGKHDYIESYEELRNALRQSPKAPNSFRTHFDPFNALMHEGGGHWMQERAGLKEPYLGTNLHQVKMLSSDPVAQGMLYRINDGETAARFVGGGSSMFTEDQLRSPGFVAKILDTNREDHLEVLRGMKELDLLRERNK